MTTDHKVEGSNPSGRAICLISFGVLMRKLLILFVSCVLVVVLNFALWFYHTRVINDVLVSLKENLSGQGITISYGEVLFSTFRYWNVKGSIENFQLAMANTDKGDPIILEYNMDKLYFESQPLNAKIILHTGSDRRTLKTASNSANPILSSPQILEIKNTDPLGEVLEIDFFDSVSQLLNVGSSEKKKSTAMSPISSVIKKLSYQNNDITTTDIGNNQEYSYIKNLLIKYESDLSNNGYVYNVFTNIGGLKFNQQYPFSSEINKLYKEFSFFDPEGVTFNINFSMDQYQSPTQIEFYKKAADQKQDVELKTIFDSLRYNITDISYHSNALKFSVTGQLNFENVDSSANVKMRFENYKMFFETFVHAYNYRLTTDSQSMTAGLKEIGAQDLKNIEDYLAQFAENNTLILNVTKKKEEPKFMIADRDAKTVFYDFLKVLHEATRQIPQEPQVEGNAQSSGENNAKSNVKTEEHSKN